MDNTDIRTYDAELTRDDTTGVMKLSGYGAVWDQPSLKGDFVEYISPTALEGVDLSSVLLLYAHDFNNILARVDANTLSLKVDQKGLYFEATLPDTTLAHDVYNNIQAGNVKGVSIGFNIASGGDSWDYRDGETVHTITQIERLNELSLTPIPAYTQTSVEVQRDYQALKNNGGKDMADKPEDKDEDKQVDPKVDPADTKPADKPEANQGDDKDAIGQLTDMVAHLTEQVQALTSVPAPVAEVVAEDDPADDEAKPKQETAEIEKRDGKQAEVTAEQDIKQENKRDGEKQMAKNLTADKVEDEEVRDFKEFLKTGEIKRDSTGFDSTAGEAVLPSQVLDIMSQPKDPAQLGGYVTKVQVSAPTGKIPVLSKASAQLVSAAELADNPKLANASLTQVNYDVQTLRGSLPISLEMTQDYPNITSLLTQYINDIKDQTEQHKIGAVLQTATPVAAKSIDDIKDAFNVGLSNYTDRMFVVSESFFAAIDKQKDAEGRYLLQDSITSPSGKQLFGAPLVVVADDVLGKSGDAKAFIGSVKNFVVETVKGNINLSWQRNENFEQVLLAALRADFKAADTAAGKFITYTAPVASLGK
ncbi:phage major capsid protein, HK97 family [Lacticaseibacillus paracasei]|uniref:phage major capsid protein n=1 Tax=Lacticaseibacillus paracasei TaxID=1597 RepID=UPI000F43DD1E|nr:phage major capsid protein [Lacticaseibacillus paracasei]RND64624.1 phage major capsid protein, HK97 family [Lacticaseibacillus paracasei]RND70321.1 phage major capsid protein, HK97 family [Lacticaseibacillus paracasei]